MAGELCVLCQIIVPNEEDHVFGKSHQLILHKHQMTKNKERTGVFITGWPNMIKKEEIEKFLQSHGKIVDMYIDPSNKFSIIQFIDEETAKKVIASKLIFKGRSLVVKHRKSKDNNNQNQDLDISETKNDHFISFLENIKYLPLYDQLKCLVEHLQEPCVVSNIKYMRLCTDIQKILTFTFPGCTVYPFGSTITGLDFQGSDVDIYVDIPQIYTYQMAKEKRAANLVKLTRDILYRSNIISNIICIPSAKTPIVKCVHRPTGISCDINFKNMLGVCNSYLIRYYLLMDYKLIKIAVTLKKWGKYFDLIGSTGKISCYGIIMMLIFYLQQEPFYLPSVKCLQEDYNVKDMQDHWNGGFFKNFRPNLSTLNEESSCNLLYGFFKYYSEFKYSKNIICPFIGKPIQKSVFLNHTKVPPSFKLYLENLSLFQPLSVDKPLCIQDPFEQNNNITKGINIKFLDEFVSACKSAAKVFCPNIPNISLCNLFTGDIETQKYEKGDGSWEFSWKLKKKQLYFKSHNEFGLNKNKVIWMKTAVGFVKKVLTDILKFDINSGSSSNMKNSRLNDQIDVSNDDTCKLTGACYVNLWESRKNIERDLVLKDDVKTILDKQTFITNYICSDLLKNRRKSKPILEIDLFMSFSSSALAFNFKKISEDQSKFKSFCMFFNTAVKSWFDIYEKELNVAQVDNTLNNKNETVTSKTNLDNKDEVIVID